MRSIAVIYLLAVVTSPVFNQLVSDEISKKLIPLKSVRSDVEKMAAKIESHPAYERYETEEEFIDVDYAQGPCTVHGWNVLRDTVLSYKIYPKRNMSSIKSDSLLATRFVRTIEDDLSSYYASTTLGVAYKFGSDGTLSYIRRIPSSADSRFRCDGFPVFSPSAETYGPVHRFEVKNPSRWDPGQLGGFLIMLQNQAGTKGAVFVYSEVRHQQIKSLRSRIEAFAYRTMRIPKGRLTVIYGGIRDEPEVEAYIVPVDYPDPIPRPWYPRKKSR